MSKTIFFDIDGTLVEKGETTLSEQRQQQLTNLSNKFKIAVCTGRGWPGVKKIGITKHFTGPQVLEIGTKIYDPFAHKLLAKSILDTDGCSSLLENLYISNPDICFGFWSDDWKRVVFCKKPEIISAHKKIFGKLIIADEFSIFLGSLSEIKPSLIRINNISFRKPASKLLENFTHYFNMSGTSVDIISKDCNKGVGLIKYGRLTREEISSFIYIGNSEKDEVVKKYLPNDSVYILGQEQGELTKIIDKITSEF